MLPASSTLGQTLPTGDVNELQSCEEGSEQVSSHALPPALISNMIFETKTQHEVANDNVQPGHPMQASEEAYILDKDKHHSSSPLTAGSCADMALVPPSPTPSAEYITNDNDCTLTTLVRQDLQCLIVTSLTCRVWRFRMRHLRLVALSWSFHCPKRWSKV